MAAKARTSKHPSSKAKKFLPIAVSLLIAVMVLGGGVAWLNLKNHDTTTDDTVLTVDSPKEVETPKEPTLATKQELLDEVNRRRTEVGVIALQHSAALDASAQQKCDDMVNRNYWGHIDPDGHQGYDIAREKMGYNGGWYSENLTRFSLHAGAEATAVNVFDGWFDSKPHREAALDSKYTFTGFGICQNDARAFFVEHFYGP